MLQVRTVVSRVTFRSGVLNLNNAIANAVEEIPIVTDYEQSTLECSEEGLEPIEGSEVEVVRRLVKEEYVDFREADELAREGDFRSLAS